MKRRIIVLLNSIAFCRAPCVMRLALCVLFLASLSYAAQETLVLETYYPSPYGVYNELRLFPRAPLSTPCTQGVMYYDNVENTMKVCDGAAWRSVTGYWAQTGSGLYPTNTAWNVGIGTTNPQRKVEISAGGAYNGAAIRFSGLPGNGDNILLEAMNPAGTGGAWSLGSNGINNERFVIFANSAGSERLRIDVNDGTTMLNTAGGNTQIGFLSAPPAPARLSVSGNVAIGGSYITTAPPANGLIVEGNVGIGTTSPLVWDPSGRVLHIVSSTGAATLRTTGGSIDGGLVASVSANGIKVGSNSGHPLLFYTGNAERMRIDTAGNVGIGTTSPAYKLDVNGDSKGTRLCIGSDCRSAWPSGGGGNVTINSQAGPNFTLSAGSGVAISTVAANNIQISATGSGGIGGSGSTNYVSKWTGSTSLGNSQIYDTGSYVGVGTSSPGQKLSIGNPGNIEILNGQILVRTAYSGSTLQLLARDVRTSNNEDLYLNWDDAGGSVVIGGQGERKYLYMAGPNGATGAGSYIDTPDVYIRSTGKWASQAGGGGPTSGQRFELYNGGGGVTNTLPLGTWAFCAMTGHEIDETGGSQVNNRCDITGSLNGSWTMTLYVGSNENGRCAAFCVNW